MSHARRIESSESSEEVVAARGKHIDQLPLIQTDAAVLHARGDHQTVALLQVMGHAVAVKLKAALGNIGGLHMNMAVQRPGR